MESGNIWMLGGVNERHSDREWNDRKKQLTGLQMFQNFNNLLSEDSEELNTQPQQCKQLVLISHSLELKEYSGFSAS